MLVNILPEGFPKKLEFSTKNVFYPVFTSPEIRIIRINTKFNSESTKRHFLFVSANPSHPSQSHFSSKPTYCQVPSTTTFWQKSELLADGLPPVLKSSSRIDCSLVSFWSSFLKRNLFPFLEQIFGKCFFQILSVLQIFGVELIP